MNSCAKIGYTQRRSVKMPAIGDNPIRSVDDDKLGRHAVAQSLAREIRAADTSEGYVLGVVGAWGSGKTSLLNLVTSELETEPELTVIKFNPWMFSGTDQLVEAFFHELAAQLKESGSSKFEKISSTVDRYSELFSPVTMVPVVGAWYERAQKVIKAAKKYGDGNSPSINARKTELSNLLQDLDTPIVVTIDDIDRLNSVEIRDLFKLVRLTGNFPNLVYVLAFDRQRVEAALTADGIEGRAYLEKIVQHGIFIPELPQQKLLEQLGISLNTALEDINLEHFDEARWQDMIIEIVLPLIRNMRDVRRYSVSAASTARELAEYIDLGDLLTMEAIRVFRPDRFELLIKARRALTTERATGTADSEHKRLVEETVSGEDDTTNTVVRALIGRVFPLGEHHIGGTSYGDGYTRQWLRERRMANAGIFSLYLERVLPDEIAQFIESERIYGILSNRQELETHIDALDPSLYTGIVSSLETFEEDFPEDAVVPASSVLLNLIPKIPKTQGRGLFDFGGPELTVSRVVLRLLRRLDGKDAVSAAVDQILPELSTLSAKFSIISMVGYREGVGHELVSEESAEVLELALVSEIAATSYANLAKEWDLLRLLSTPEYWGLRTSPVVTDFSVPAFHAAVLRQARSEILSQGLGSRAVNRRYTMHWETLERIYGSDDGIRQAVQAIKAWRGRKDDVLISSIELAEKYLTGWRPDRR